MERYYSDGNGWSKLNGYFTVRGDSIYWEDGDVTPNDFKHCVFTAMHESIPGWEHLKQRPSLAPKEE